MYDQVEKPKINDTLTDGLFISAGILFINKAMRNKMSLRRAV